MRLIFRILSGALIAPCWSGLANADPQAWSQPLDVAAIRAITTVQLDAAFENFVSREYHPSFAGLAGPSAMVCIKDCQTAEISEPTEICVVTADGPTRMMPAALAKD